jgi:hypothetical protein
VRLYGFSSRLALKVTSQSDVEPVKSTKNQPMDPENFKFCVVASKVAGATAISKGSEEALAEKTNPKFPAL